MSVNVTTPTEQATIVIWEQDRVGHARARRVTDGCCCLLECGSEVCVEESQRVFVPAELTEGFGGIDAVDRLVPVEQFNEALDVHAFP